MKQVIVSNLSKILVVHIKRFEYKRIRKLNTISTLGWKKADWTDWTGQSYVAWKEL